MALSAGNIAFVGFNVDGNDDFAFVAIVDINLGESITFEDNEWDGSAFNTGEGRFTWTANSLVTAGTIVSISNASLGTRSASTGTLSASAGSFNLAGSDESLYAYQGTVTAPTFITAISNNAFSSAAIGTLTNTGLTAGVNALALTSNIDVAAYNGSRTGLNNFAAYLSLINNPANWQTQDGSGNQNSDSIAPDVPFSSTVFTINAVATPTVTIAAQDAAAAEAGSNTGIFRISRTGDTTSALTVNYTVATGTGQATSVDYTPTLTGTATIAAGQFSVDITITPVDDTAIEGSETVTLTLVDGTNYDLGATGTEIATVAIADNDASPTPTVELSVTSNAGTEAGATSITVTATASSAVLSDQTVTLTVTGTNITTGDYTLNNTTTNSVTITILSGQTTGTATFRVIDWTLDKFEAKNG
ncbi:MAG: hypothetical protein ACOYN8_17740 [Pseudanabaena sp.]|jgi:hypothetical protein